MNNEKELFNQAYELQRQGKLVEALGLYEKLLKLQPNQAQALQFAGIASAQLGKLQQAFDFFAQALAFEPDNANFHNNLANVYKNAKEIDQAISHYLKAIQLKPQYAQAHHNLATVYAAQNNYQSALSHYRAAVHAEPDFALAHFNLGLLLLQNNQLAAAKTQFKNVLTLNAEHPEAEFYLGVLYLEANELAEAEQHFQQTLIRDANHVQVLTNLGVIALKREQGQIAVDYFSRAIANDNDNLEARNNLAATFMHYDRFENALMHYDVLLQHEPNNIEYLYNSGVAQMALGHLNEALEHFDKLVSIDDHHFAALNNLAAIYIRLEDREKAQSLLQRALIANPQDKTSSHMLAALKGDATNATTCPDYAKNLFNNYALYYDQHMQNQLHYNLPQHIARIIHKLKLLKLTKVLDLGCGTGLTGSVLREISQELTGVDLAKKMLAQAQEKGIYDHLIETDLLKFLKDDKELYELVVAVDVLPYFGELDSLFAALKERLSPKGYFIFSTEISRENPWVLEMTARFSHHFNYISQLCQSFGLELIHHETVVARQQNDKGLEVEVYVVCNRGG
ncbi:MAG: tetratricopeptide repeat protein [Tatlockia sp.]|nr:tetratricopeptide repeat protein [Tatlockia sp.]